jgi:hypothetical protein
VVALDTTARAEAAPRAGARHAGTRWLVATGAVLVVGSLAPLAIAPGIGHVSAAVMMLLLGAGVATVALVLGSARAAFFATLGITLLLDLGRLPPRATPGFEEPQALWQVGDQRIEAVLSASGAAPSHLALLADAVYQGERAPYGLAATINGQDYAWQCSFQHGRQWLELPVDNAEANSLDVKLALSGAPDRQANYLVVYRSATRDGWLLGLTEDPAAPAPITSCTRA